MQEIAIYGASGHGKVVADIAEALGYKIAYFIDDDMGKTDFMGCAVERMNINKLPVALGIGNNKTRQNIFSCLCEENVEILTLIHPSCVVSKRATFGIGSVVMPNAVINSCAKIGKGVIVNTASVIEHDNVIGDFVHISPNVALAGNVKIGELSHIGIGSTVIQNITIGKEVVIGAGSVVIDDIADFSKVVGNPAKKYLNN